MQQFHRNFDLGVSQAEHPEVFEGVPSEGEGIRLVKKKHGISSENRPHMADPRTVFAKCLQICRLFFSENDTKKLPEKMIRSCTMNPEYWKKTNKSRSRFFKEISQFKHNSLLNCLL